MTSQPLEQAPTVRHGHPAVSTGPAASHHPPRLWSIQDVSAFLGVPVATIYQWRVRGDGPPAMRLGRHLRYDPDEVAAWAHEQQDHGRGRP